MPTFWQLYHGEQQLGVTIHYMAAKVDEGDALLQESLPVTPGESLHNLIRRSKRHGAHCMAKVVRSLQTNEAVAIQMDHAQGSYFTFPKSRRGAGIPAARAARYLIRKDNTWQVRLARSALRAHGKVFWAGLLRASGMLSLARKWVQRHGAIVLTFHRVLTDSELQQTASLGGMIVRSGRSPRFLKYASSSANLPIWTASRSGSPASKLKLAVTFDDGWSDNA